ncbi:MAG: GNAT family N-acetyltransferase [Bacteroidia bacterium]|nr:GNAT family N-acetyltransferase [Bacteroidia bacterium]
MTVRPLARQDLELVCGWVESEALLFQCSADTFQFPLNPQDLLAYHAAHPHRLPYLLMHPGLGPAGVGEIIPEPPDAPRLARLLIAPGMRGRGMGEQLVRLLSAECQARFPGCRVTLFVLETNHQAIACYQKAGFGWSDEPGRTLQFNGQALQALKMQLR